jgi:hypothetical protein
MRDLLYLAIVAIFSVATWGLVVLFAKLLGEKK